MLMLFQGLSTWACCVAVAAHKSSIFHVGVEELDLIVLPRFVLPQPGLGLESLVAGLALMWQHRLLYLLLLLLLFMLLWVLIPNVPSPRSRVIEYIVAVFAWKVAFGVGQILRMRIEHDETIWQMPFSL